MDIGNITFEYAPETYTDRIGTYYVWTDSLSTVTGPIEVNVAGWKKDEIEVTQDGQYVDVDLDGGTYRRVYVGNNKVSKATYKAGMLTLHFEDTSNVIPVE